MRSSSKKIIGIAAGMGPRSTGPFLDEVVNECQFQYGAMLDDDFPEMVILSLPAPFRLNESIDHAEMKRVIIGGLQKLEANGVSFIAIPCNTAHTYFDDLKKSISIPLLNIIDETVANLPKGLSVTLFGTRTTFDSGLYQSGVDKAGCDFKFENEWQPVIDETIASIKSGDLTTARNRWQDLQQKASKHKIQAVICGCTDLNVVARLVRSDIQFIDSTKSLAKAVVREYLRED